MMDDTLTVHQRETLSQFRSVVADLKDFWRDDEGLLRWLRSRHWNVSKAEKMIRKSFEWRKENKIDTMLEEFEIPEVISKYFPGGYFGEDKLGHPIYIDPIGRIDLKGICYSVKKNDIIKCRVYTLEQLYRHILPEQRRKHGREIKRCTAILDYEHFGKPHLWLPGGELYIGIISTLEANYPETLYRSYIINAPKIFSLAFNFVRPFMSEDTIKKVEFLGVNWKERLLEEIDADQLPAHYGGTRTDPDEFCSSQICYGGKVPVSYYRKKEDLIPEGRTFQNIYISRRSVFRLEFQVSDTNCALRWVFTTENHDVAYGVYFKKDPKSKSVKDMEVLQEWARVGCHIVPEDGIIHCDKIGTYVIQFDNSFSRLRGKNVSYFVDLIADGKQTELEPSNEEEVEVDAPTDEV